MSNPEDLLYSASHEWAKVNGEEAVMDRILPSVKKYGAAVVGLTLDEKGIPDTAEERFAIAERILTKCLEYGIPRENVIIDCLTLTVSAQQKETDALKGRMTEVEQTADAVAISVEKIEADGVSKVTTSTGFTFDENGMTVEKSGSGTKTTVDETGLTVADANGAAAEELLYAGVDAETGESVVKAKNIRVSKYLVVGKNSRFEDYEADGEQRTGCFFIG